MAGDLLKPDLPLSVVGGDAAVDADNVAALELLGQLVYALERARLDLRLAVAQHDDQERHAARRVDDRLTGARQQAVDPLVRLEVCKFDR